MNIKQQLAREHSKTNTLKIVNYIDTNKKRFNVLINIILKNPALAQRAAWVLGHCGESNPQLISPYIKSLITNLDNNTIHDAVIRNTMRVLQFTSIPEKELGIVYNKCFELLTSRKMPVAVKVFSMTVMCNICMKEPGLKNELLGVIQNEIQHESAGYKARAKKIIHILNKL